MNRLVTDRKLGVFISSTSDLNRFGEDLRQQLIDDDTLGSIFVPFYYTAHVPIQNEPDIEDVLNSTLQASQVFIRLVSDNVGTEMPSGYWRRLFRRLPETYVSYEERRATELRLAVRQFRHVSSVTPEGRWITTFSDSSDLCSKAREFLARWLVSFLANATWNVPRSYVAGVAALCGLAGLAGILGLTGHVTVSSAIAAIAVAVVAAVVALIYLFVQVKHR